MFNVFARSRMAALALPVAMLVGGCSSSKQAPEATKAVDSIQTVSKEVGKGGGVLDQVIGSIDQLQAGGDLKVAFANYTDAVADLEAAGKRVQERRQAMQANRAAYVDKWQQDQEQIQNADVRAASAARKEQVSAKFDSVRGSMDKVRDGYQPLLKDLQEIQKGLALDLNPGGVTAMKPALDKAKAQSMTLKANIASLQAELQSVAGSMSATSAPATAPAK